MYGDVSSNNDLKQLMFIIENNGLFMWNEAAVLLSNMMESYREAVRKSWNRAQKYDLWTDMSETSQLILQQGAQLRDADFECYSFSLPAWLVRWKMSGTTSKSGRASSTIK